MGRDVTSTKDKSTSTSTTSLVMGDPVIDPQQWPPYTLTATTHGVDVLLSVTAHGVDSILSTPWRYTLHLNHVNPMGRQPPRGCSVCCDAVNRLSTTMSVNPIGL